MHEAEAVNWLIVAIFSLSIFLIVSRLFEESLAGFLGVALILLLGLDALDRMFGEYVDWNVISILLGMWILSAHLTYSGVPEYIAHKIVGGGGGKMAIVLKILIVTGFITLFVDNVLAVLLIVPLAVKIARIIGVNPADLAILVALSANYMGTALLIGDLPPQLIHSVFRAEFMDFIVMDGLPSSFPILTVSFILTILIYLAIMGRRGENEYSGRQAGEIGEGKPPNINWGYARISIAFITVAIVLMALRREISIAAGYDIPLGVFPLAVAMVSSMVIEKLKYKPFKEVIEKGIEWNAILFYIALFMLVGSLERSGFIDLISESIQAYITDPAMGYTMIYWISAPIVGFIEHDAYILILLKVLKELYVAGSIQDPWPLVWALAWSGTLGSNLTAAGAPALYVAFKLYETHTGKRLHPKKIYSVTVPYTLISLAVTFVISYPIWVILR